MIDFHTHILPDIDDGSKSVEESIEMLKMLKNQGISKVVLSPHFYANRFSVSDFLKKRHESFEKLSSYLTDDLPDVLLGAEVKYYEGISRLESLTDLCIGESKLLLLEMPVKKWTEYIIRELREISSSGKIVIVLAHIERYLHLQDKLTLEELVSFGILVQSNAEFFLNFFTRHKAVSLLNANLIHFIGSDCHNLTNRAPKIGNAISYIEHKAGNTFIKRMNSLAERFL